MTTNSVRVLVMTIGTGDVARLEETLLTPLRKSIATDAWARVILLPSSVTEEFAQRLGRELQGAEVAIRPLPGGDENDAESGLLSFRHRSSRDAACGSTGTGGGGLHPRHQGHECRVGPGGDTSWNTAPALHHRTARPTWDGRIRPGRWCGRRERQWSPVIDVSTWRTT